MRSLTRYPLRFTLPLFLLLVLGIISLYTMLDRIHFSEKMVEKNSMTTVIQYMGRLQGRITHDLPHHEMAHAGFAVASFGSDQNVAVVVMANEQDLVVHATRLELVGLTLQQALPGLDLDLVRKVRKTNLGKVLLAEDRGSLEAYYSYQFRPENSGLGPFRAGFLFMRYDLNNLNAANRYAIEQQMLSSLLCYVLAFLLLGAVLHYVLTKRVQRLVNVAETFARGETSVRCGLNGRDEIARVGGAIDWMLQRITADSEELRRSRAEYQSLVEETPDLVARANHRGRLSFVNHSSVAILGLTPEKCLGRSVFDFLHREDRQATITAFIDSLKSDKPTLNLENRVVGVDGRLHYMIWTVRLERSAQGKITGFAGTGRDITKRKEAEKALAELNAQLEAKNKEMEQVLYVSSHDLGAPLVTIEGFNGLLANALEKIFSLLEDTEITPEIRQQRLAAAKDDCSESFTFISNSVLRMNSLLDGLLRVSRVGRIEIHIEELDMNKLMSALVSEFAFKSKERGVKIAISALPSCFGDAGQINQLFANLIGNALKYSAPERPGVIKISGRTDGHCTVYCIEDNGIGIAPEFKEKIFEMFHQLNPEADGEGLGLSIVRKVVERHHGQISMESELGKGCTFYVSLPNKVKA